jgi:PAS domain S-box-containing protein
LKGRTEHLRLSELRDTNLPRKEQTVDAARLAELHMGSALLVVLRVSGKPAGFLGLAHTMPRGPWDVNTQLLMKLVGTSLATGLERLRTEARLAKLEERTALYQAAANDGLWDYDVESNEMYVSPRWKAMLGYADEDMPGSPDWRALVHPDDLSRVQAALREHVAGKTQIFESTHRMRHRNGEWRWVNSRATARVDKQGRLLRLVGVELDITERKLYEEALFREKQSAQITLSSPPMATPPSNTSTRWPKSSPAGASRMPWDGRWKRSSAPSMRRPASRWKIRCRFPSAVSAPSRQCDRCC